MSIQLYKVFHLKRSLYLVRHVFAFTRNGLDIFFLPELPGESYHVVILAVV